MMLVLLPGCGTCTHVMQIQPQLFLWICVCVVELFRIIQELCVRMRVWIEHKALVQICDAPMTHEMTTFP